MGFLSQLTRRKTYNVQNEESELSKVLSTFDLTALGVGCTLGVGIFVLPGVVARDIAGPSVIISFFIAAVTSVLAGLCYAEFGARVPKAGSAYAYSYVTVGEFSAFVIGWSLIIEYIIGSASVAKALSLYVDATFNYTMEGFYRSLYEIKDVSMISEYFDMFAFVLSLVVTFGLAFGLKESLVLNNALTAVNVFVVIFVIIVGAFEADISNWKLPASQVPSGSGEGGFFPYGVGGTIAGASTCFFGYVGFDSISASGEEVKNPQKAIPTAIILSLFISFLAYCGVSAVLTLMWPYYLQDRDAPIPFVFNELGLDWAKWLIAIGGLFGMLASLVAGIFPLPRIIYAMANDGLLFKFLGRVHSKYRTPLIGTLLAGLVTGFMASLFKLKQLVDLMSIATLLAYTIVSACVLLLRYRYEEPERIPTHESAESTFLIPNKVYVTWEKVLCQSFNSYGLETPTKITSAVVAGQTLLFCVGSVVLSILNVYWGDELISGEIWILVLVIVLILLLVTSLLSISMQPPSTTKLLFKVPWVPVIPALSILTNIYLMILMDFETWVRFGAWLAIGLFIYFSYGIRHSTEKRIQPVEYSNIKSDGEFSDG